MVTAFSVKVLPDKYYAPKFGMSTNVTKRGTTIPMLNHNTAITFKNAKFADFVYEQSENGNISWSLIKENSNAESLAINIYNFICKYLIFDSIKL